MTATASTSTIRAWAIAEGLDVADRGRLKPDVLKAYADAHGGTAKAKAKTAKPAKAPVKNAPKQPVRVGAKVALKAGSTDEVLAEPTSPNADQQPLEDKRFTDLELAVSALTARVASLEAAAPAPAAGKKRFGRKS